MFGEGKDDGWDDEGEGDLLFLDGAVELLQLEALHHVDRDALVDCLQEEHRNTWNFPYISNCESGAAF